jgi:hypothetical protein
MEGLTSLTHITLSESAAPPLQVKVVWPSGWAAWRVAGRAELDTPDGTVIAREEDVIENEFGGSVGVDNAFHVCVIGG